MVQHIVCLRIDSLQTTHFQHCLDHVICNYSATPFQQKKGGHLNFLSCSGLTDNVEFSILFFYFCIKEHTKCAVFKFGVIMTYTKTMVTYCRPTNSIQKNY